MIQGDSKDQPVPDRSRDARSAATRARRRRSRATVEVVQGDTTMKCLTRSSSCTGRKSGSAADGTPAATAKPAPGMPQGAREYPPHRSAGGVTVITKDQDRRAAILGIYDLKSTRRIRLSGNVVVSQAKTSFTASVSSSTRQREMRALKSGSSGGTGTTGAAPGPRPAR